MTAYTPSDGDQLRDMVAYMVAERVPVELFGAGSKRALGRPAQTEHSLDLSKLTGVRLYEPEELVMSAGVGTALGDIETKLAEHHQQLAFEPADYGPLLGGAAGAGTIGGVFACNLSGPRRIKAGAARDHFLGMSGVTGRGEVVKFGGRVVKNVTGYDLCKLLAGSYGTLAAMSEVTFKVLPAPEKTRTVLIHGLDDARAITAMGDALNSANEVSGAAHLPEVLAGRSRVGRVALPYTAITALRIEGPEPSVLHRCTALREQLAGYGEIEELHGHNSATFWREVRDVLPFAQEQQRQVWRLSLPPKTGASVVAAIRQALDVEAYYDWGGGLVWLASAPLPDAGHAAVRQAIGATGGHATLMRASPDVRAAVPVFQPQEQGLAGLTKRVKEGFDPNRVLNPGRMYAGL